MTFQRTCAALVGALVATSACGGSDDPDVGDDAPAQESSESESTPDEEAADAVGSDRSAAGGSVTVGDVSIQFVPEICSIRENGAMIDIAGSGTTDDGGAVFVSLSRQEDQGVDIALGSIDIGRESLTTPADPAQPSFRVLRPDGQESGGPASFEFDDTTGTFSGTATARDDNGIATSGDEIVPISWAATC